MPAQSQTEREFDIVVWGATGFTGRLVAEYLMRADGSHRIALAGRNRDKLQSIREELTDEDAGQPEPPLIIADASDQASLEAMASRTRVVCTTVGPYAKYGAPLVSACVARKTHYCDLTGEVHFVRRSIDAHHDQATADRTRIVHCCGFDSIPSDLGTLMLQTEAKHRWGRPFDEVKTFAGELKGGLSGGTIASMLELIDEARKDPEIRRLMGNPYSLNPTEAPKGPDGQDQRGVRFDEDMGMWTGPFLMAPINTRVVRRSNALLDFQYGREFRYSEVASTGRGPRGALLAGGLAAGITALVVGAAVPLTRPLLERALPSPGEGPTEEQMRRGKFVLRMIGKGQDGSGGPTMLRAEVVGHADPGYRGTAIMLGETALCLALDTDEIPARGGVLTPASAMGMRLVDRLRDAGMTWAVHS